MRFYLNQGVDFRNGLAEQVGLIHLTTHPHAEIALCGASVPTHAWIGTTIDVERATCDACRTKANTPTNTEA